MKRLLLLIVLFMFFLVSGFAETVTLGYDEWFPFMGEDLPELGFFSQLVKEAFALEGVTVVYEKYPWPRIEVMVERGSLDGSLGYMYTDERAEKYLFTDPLWTENYSAAFFLKSRNLQLDSTDDLRGLSLITQRGYSYGPIVDGMIAEGEVENNVVQREDQAFKMLMAGRADVFLTNNVNGNFFLSQNLADKKELFSFGAYDPSMLGVGNCVIISKEIPGGAALVEKFNRGFQKMKESGRFDEIAAPYR